ncbi:endothelin-converting enzyme 1-like [Musca vetustissima]|uniref:endothelin-converting enzyme 1-like n=1 Tax=Musca vetustissima TaxID=27455 RepID=UPI002AB7768C|nr:endothelin-converting enzyme 1-like [Musca vetustissima]
MFDELNKDFDRRLIELLNNEEVGNWTDAERKIKTFYSSCVNSATGATSLYIKEKFKEISSEFGLFPYHSKFLSERKEQEFDWLKTVAKISHTYGFNIIFGFSVKPDAKDHTSHNLILGGEKFQLHHHQRLRHEYEEILKYINFHPETANGVAWQIIDFESSLLQANHYGAQSPVSGSVDSIHNKYFPQMDIKRFLNISFGYVPAGIVWLENPGYLDNLIKTLKFTPKKLVMNYIVTKLLHHFWLDLGHQHLGQMELCVKVAKEKFPHILSQMFIKSNTEIEEKIKGIERLWAQLKSSLQRILESKRPTWFDVNTRQMATDKLHSMTIQVATYEHHNFENEYRWQSFNPNDYIENLRTLRSFEAFRKRQLLYQKPQHEHVSLDLRTPVYVISSNSIIVPVSILNSQFLWSSSNPNVMNLAHLGFCIAHEIMHAFSGEGRNYNQEGNFYKYWNTFAEHKYNELESCLVEQYGNYTGKPSFLSKLHKPDHKQDENVADNAGIVLAYETFKKDSNYELDVAFKYTHDQLFFINYAQLWCADTWQKENMEGIVASGRHAHDELRVLVPLQNFDEFSKVFKCSKGSAMNPYHKLCLDWLVTSRTWMVQVNLRLNDRALYTNEFPAWQIPPFCFPISPQLFLTGCLQVHSLGHHNFNTLHACGNVTINVITFNLINWPIGCVDVGSSGVQLVEPNHDVFKVIEENSPGV